MVILSFGKKTLLEIEESQPEFTCSKLTIEILRWNKEWNMFKVKHEDIRTTSLASFYAFTFNFEHISHLALVFLLLTLKI